MRASRLAPGNLASLPFGRREPWFAKPRPHSPTLLPEGEGSVQCPLGRAGSWKGTCGSNQASGSIALTARRGTSLRVLLILLAAGALLPLALMSGIGLFLLDSHHRDQTRRLGVGTARALSMAVDAELNRAMAVLLALAGEASLEEGDVQRFRDHAQRVMRTHPDWLLIALTSPDGEQLMSTRADPGTTPAPVVEPESLRRLVRERVPTVGFVERGPGGNYAVPVRVPVRVPVMVNGALRYVLSGAVKPDAFAEVVKRQKVRADWVISIFDARGTRVARSRSHEHLVGGGATPSLQKLLERTGEGWELTHTIEGDPVFTAFSRSPGTGWAVAVGIPQPLMREGAARTLAAYGSGLMMSLGLALIAVVLIARRITIPMASLRAAARTLARREVPVIAPTRVTEIGEVGDALVAAGEERARVEGQRERLLRGEQEARAAAERANRFKDEFVSMLSHELRNPIAAIAAASRLLEPELAEDDVALRAGDVALRAGDVALRARAVSAVIRRQADQLGRLADDLLVAEAALQGRIVLETRSVDLAIVAREVLQHTIAARDANSHRVSEALESVWVNADPLRLEQMIARLLDNAFKFTPDGGSIRVSSRAEAGEGVLVVADNGIGMTPDLAQRVFELFAQAEREPHRPQGGLGIGLTLVRRLAQLHRGSATARSAGPGKGSEFEVRLPRAPTPQPQAAAENAQPAPRPRHVLVIEDNADARTMLQLLLQSAGHRVRVARDGVEGLQAVLDEQPDIALIDIGLPRMDGYEVARRIHETFPAAGRPFLVAVTGYGLPADQRRAMAAGFDVHLVKPIDYAVLETIFARLG
ncbi:MAG: response regulator [Betaproteobacteria bacterium]|nr:response regulator [Betaproteobacteria bacterium]